MAKKNYHFEFEINSPEALIYTFITVPKSMRFWFADDVTAIKNEYNFVWEGEDHKATLFDADDEYYVKYTFTADHEDPSYVEFRIEFSEMTQTSFLIINEYSSPYSDEKEAKVLWEQMIADLKEAIGDHH